jgi:hypothetical protein
MHTRNFNICEATSHDSAKGGSLMSRSFLHRIACVLAPALLSVATVQPTVGAEVPRNVLKSYFETGDIPTQEQFNDLIDSSLNLVDDGLTIYSASNPSGRAPRLGVGEEVGPDLSFAPVADVLGFSDDWLGQSGFLALAFEQDSDLHYAYLQISTPVPGAPNPYSMTVEYLVYQDAADTPLVTQTVPEPSTLVLAAAGMLALVAAKRRRRRR